MNLFQLFGLNTLFKVCDTLPRLRVNRREVDVLDESWWGPSENALVVGDVHPERPGMIIDALDVIEEVPGVSYRFDLTALGSADNTKPTKIIGRGKRRTLSSGWDERRVECLSWHADWLDCTADASSDVVTTLAPHGFLSGQAIVFARLTGGAGLTPQSSSSLGVIVYVRRINATTFTCHTSAAGSLADTGRVDITTNMTAGQVIAAEFALGSPHPSCPNLFLMEIELQDENTDWKRATVIYMGLEEDKPFKRMIRCNGQSMSSSGLIYWDFPDGGFDAARRAVNLPQVVVEDTYLTVSALATSTVPLSQGEGGTPPNAPAIRTVTIVGSADQIVYQWPAGWSRMAVAHGDTLNCLLAPNITVITSEYRWPILLN